MIEGHLKGGQTMEGYLSGSQTDRSLTERHPKNEWNKGVYAKQRKSTWSNSNELLKII